MIYEHRFKTWNPSSISGHSSIPSRRGARWRRRVFILPASSHVQSRVADVCEGSVSKWRLLHAGRGAVIVGQAPMDDRTTTLPPADHTGIVGLGV